jgi:hypothetical protein
MKSHYSFKNIVVVKLFGDAEEKLNLYKNDFSLYDNKAR